MHTYIAALNGDVRHYASCVSQGCVDIIESGSNPWSYNSFWTGGIIKTSTRTSQLCTALRGLYEIYSRNNN